MSRILVAVSAKLGAGKDVFADLAVSEYGFVKIPFAKALKDEVRQWLLDKGVQFEERNINGTQADREEVIAFPCSPGDLVEEHPWLAGKCRDLTYRHLLQLWGTEYRRATDDDYWVRRALIEASQYERVVISDLRFYNEFLAVRLVGGRTVRINRPDAYSSPTAWHASEVGLDHIKRWDYKIDNDSTLHDFQTSCRYVLESIVG